MRRTPFAKLAALLRSSPSTALGASLRVGLWTVGLCAALPAAAIADTITLTDGKTFDNVTIVTETLKEITFKQDGKSKTTPSDGVVSVEYKRKPKLVDQADAMAADGDVGGALDTLDTYIGGLLEGNGREPLAWALPYAMQRSIDLNAAIGDGEGVIAAADRLIKNGADSRHLPTAHLSKIAVLADRRQTKEAMAAIGELRKLIDAQTLSPRWKLEADLAEALADPALAGPKRREKAIQIAGLAGKDYPTVANRARVAEGASYLEGETKDFAKARTVFEAIVADPKADKPTLAGAYTGLGDCLFAQAIDLQKASKDPAPMLRAAVEAYMRVVVVYPEQVRERSKSMYWAGRVFEFMGDDASKARARQLYRSVMREYKQSNWADEAKKQMGG